MLFENEEDEGEGDVSNFTSSQFLANLVKDIKAKRLPKPHIVNLVAMLGYDDIEDFFDDTEITDPNEQNIYRLFQGLYDVRPFGEVVPNLLEYPFVMGFEFDIESGILFLEDRSLAECINFGR